MSTPKDTGIVNIHGKEYKTVAKRVDEFRSQYKQTLAINTELVSADNERVIVKASIINTDGFVIATGFAEENRAASQINRTSALENCETSAIGRALANFGLAGGEYASADEVANAINQQGSATPKAPSRKINFQEIQDELKLLDDMDSVMSYYKSLPLDGLSDKQVEAVNKMFAYRKKQLGF